MKNNKVLVLGATGGIGRSVVSNLLSRNEEVTVLVRDKEKAKKYFVGLNKIEIIQGDILKPADLDNACKGIKALFYCINVPYTEWEAKVRLLLKTSLDAAVKAKARFVFPGNVYVYGHAKFNPVTENHPKEAHTKKGKIRIEMEEMIHKFSHKYELPFTITRFPDFYGTYYANGFSEEVFKNALAGKQIRWIGAKNIPIEYIFLEDAAKCMVEAGLSDKGINQEFNIPASGVTTNRKFFDLVIETSGNNSSVQFLNSRIIFSLIGLFNPMIKEVNEMMYLKREELILDGTKFKETFGFLPSTSYEEGIKKTFEWIKSFYRI